MLVRPALWFDASDLQTITTVSGAVSQWKDKSGNQRDISQGTAGNRPTFTERGLNNYSTILFNGTSHSLGTASAACAGVGNVSIFGAFRYVSASAEDLTISLGTGPAGSAIRAFYRTTGGTTQGFATWGNDIAASGLSTDIGGSFHLFEAVQSGQQVSLYRDGVADSTLPRTLPSAPLNISTNAFTIGSIAGTVIGTYYSNIAVAEVIVFYSAVTATVRQQIEGYIAWKWGLTSFLPAAHIYKNSPPLV
jgi:hypothetical protein